MRIAALLLASIAVSLNWTHLAGANEPTKVLPKQPLEVAIETRLISVRDDFFERIGVDFDFRYSTPSGGVLRRHLEPGYGARIGGSMNLFDQVGGNPLWKVDGIFGYAYSRYQGTQDFQLNGPKENVKIEHANTHLGDVGLALRRVYNNFTFRTSVGYHLGTIQAQTQNVAFDPAAPTVFLHTSPDASAFLHGYRVRVGGDLRLTDRVSVGAGYGFGHDSTRAFENNFGLSFMSDIEVYMVLQLGPRRTLRQPAVTLFQGR